MGATEGKGVEPSGVTRLGFQDRLPTTRRYLPILPSPDLNWNLRWVAARLPYLYIGVPTQYARYFSG